MISKIPYFYGKRITNIEVLPGGLTNSNYKVTIDDTPYAVRVAGAGAAQYINRPAEHFNARIMADLGINCPVYYHNEVTGDQVCCYVEGKTLHSTDFHEDTNWLHKTAKVFKKYHDCGKELSSKFDLLKEIEAYHALMLQKKLEFYENGEKMMAAVEEIKQAYQKNPYEEKSCHNDTLPGNWIVNGEGLFLIDWEYAGMNAPIFDLAVLSLETNLSADEERILLTEYFGWAATAEQNGRVVINKFLYDALWSIWSVLQINKGKP